MEEIIESFKNWSDRNGVHLSRHIVIMTKQTENLRSYVELFQKYPANSPEFKAEVESLLEGIKVLADELHEVNGQFAEDCSDFSGVLEALKTEILNHVEGIRHDKSE